MKRFVWLLPVVLAVVGCAPGLKDPVKFDSPGGLVDLRAWNFATEGPVIPQGWLWDADVLWSPEEGGRPVGLPDPVPLGAPDRGGSLGHSLDVARAGHDFGPSVATARLVVLVPPTRSYGLQIGAIPGAFKVWSNGVLVWESGVVSTDPLVFRADGSGTVLAVQPLEGRIELVVAIVTTDPLVRHPEYNRLWVIGPSKEMLDAERAERNWRALQAAVLVLAGLVFLGLAILRPSQRALVPFVWFLVLCLLKLMVNVEQAQPLLAPILPGVSPSVYLFLNHGLNLLPFPVMILFLVRQFPGDISLRSFWVIGGATAVATLWELLPFVALAWGWSEGYTVVMRSQWSFVLNLYVVLVVLFTFERYYHLFVRRRPMAWALFLGGVIIGLIILLPIPLSYFLPVKFTYFLGWGMFAFLLILGFELIRLQVRSAEAEVRRLTERLDLRDSVVRFLPVGWPARLGKDSLEALRPGDRGRCEAVLVQVSSPDPADLWLSQLGAVASSRQALFVEWRDGTGLWVLDAWSETALAFSLEVKRKLNALQGLRYRIVLTKALVEFHVLNGGTSWVPVVEGVPRDLLASLHAKAEAHGATLVLDGSLQDGLVIGGWRRHRHLTVSGNEIELYEGEEESLAEIKDQCLDGFETALAQARAGHLDQAIQGMVAVVQRNPFDLAARALLEEWGGRRP